MDQGWVLFCILEIGQGFHTSSTLNKINAATNKGTLFGSHNTLRNIPQTSSITNCLGSSERKTKRASRHTHNPNTLKATAQ